MRIAANIIKLICILFLIAGVIFLIVKLIAWSCTWPINAWWLNWLGKTLGLESTLAKWIVSGVIDFAITILIIFVVMSNKK